MVRLNLTQKRFVIACLLTFGVVLATIGVIGILKVRQEKIIQRIDALNRKPLQLIQDFPPATKVYVRHDADDGITYIDVYYFSYGATLTPEYEASFQQDEITCGSSNNISGDDNRVGQGRYLVNLNFERKTIPLKYSANFSTSCILPTTSLKINFVSVDVPVSDDYNWDEEGG